MVIRVFYGAERARSRAAFRQAGREAAAAAGAPLVFLREESLTPRALRDAVEGRPLFGNAPPLAAEGLTTFVGSAAEAVAKVLRAVPADRLLLVWEDGVPPATGLVWRVLTEVAEERTEFPPLTEREALTWVQEYSAADGVRLPLAAQRALLASAGLDLTRLRNELEKVLLARRAGATVEEALRALPFPEISPDVFALVRALTGGDSASALRLLTEAERAGEDPRRIFALLLREVSLLRVVRASLDRAEVLTPGALVSRFRLPRAAAVALLATARRTSARALRSLFDRGVVAYYALNRGRVEAIDVLAGLALARSRGGRC